MSDRALTELDDALAALVDASGRTATALPGSREHRRALAEIRQAVVRLRQWDGPRTSVKAAVPRRTAPLRPLPR
jgi:hypothetical protein